mgnify:FL=1
MQKLARQFGSENIDVRLDQSQLSSGSSLESSISLAEIESIDHALIVGSYTRLEQPMINHRIRKATLGGASVNTMNSKNFDFNFKTKCDALISPQKLYSELQSVLKAILLKINKDIPNELSKASPS